jgi:hypothetical protein
MIKALTDRQKKMLRDWFDENYVGYDPRGMTGRIDFNTYQAIDDVHPTPDFHAQANKYLAKLARERKI